MEYHRNISYLLGGLMIGRLLGTFVLKIIRVRTALVAYSLMAIILLAISLVTEGEFSIILMLSCGFLIRLCGVAFLIWLQKI